MVNFGFKPLVSKKIMNRLYKDIKRRLLNKIDAHGLAVFRMLYSIVFFLEILQLYRYSEILYNDAPFIKVLDFNFGDLFICWLIILIFLFFGAFTKFVTIINYLFTFLVISQQHRFEYHIFYVYVGINFLIMFIPVSRVWSIDNLIEKIKFSGIGKFYKPDSKVFALNYFIPVFVGIGLQYFDSVLYKIESPMWRAGLGMWLPANILQGTWSNLTILMNNEFAVKFLGYLVIVFETLLVFLMWFRSFRLILFIFGVSFHIGILICFPIPWFALTIIVIYLLMLPAGIWKKINLKFKKPKFTFYYDAESPLCIKTVVLINHFDVFGAIECKSVQASYSIDSAIQEIPMEQMLLKIYGVDNTDKKIYKGYDTYIQLLIKMKYPMLLGYFIKLPLVNYAGKLCYGKITRTRLVYPSAAVTGHLSELNEPVKSNEPILVSWLNKELIIKKFWKYTLGIIVFVQVICSMFSSFPEKIRYKIPYSEKLNAEFARFAKPIRYYGRNFLGITNHQLFLDFHFAGYNHNLKITFTENGKETLLPIINEEGMPGKYIRGALWANYTFRTNKADFNLNLYNSGIKRYILYWLKENNKALNGNYNFRVYVKEVEIPKHWKKDFLNSQIAKPWKVCGKVNINNGLLTSEINSNIK